MGEFLSAYWNCLWREWLSQPLSPALEPCIFGTIIVGCIVVVGSVVIWTAIRERF